MFAKKLIIFGNNESGMGGFSDVTGGRPPSFQGVTSGGPPGPERSRGEQGGGRHPTFVTPRNDQAGSLGTEEKPPIPLRLRIRLMNIKNLYLTHIDII